MIGRAQPSHRVPAGPRPEPTAATAQQYAPDAERIAQWKDDDGWHYRILPQKPGRNRRVAALRRNRPPRLTEAGAGVGLSDSESIYCTASLHPC